jgi:DNA-binding response OmpR family regulator
VKKILLAEDTTNLAENMIELLTYFGFEVKVASNGHEALKALNEYRPDLIITDVFMPVMNGLELTSHVRKKFSPEDLPIIILSAKGTPEDVAAGLNAGANVYLKKPCSVEVLIESVERLLNTKGQ